MRLLRKTLHWTQTAETLPGTPRRVFSVGPPGFGVPSFLRLERSGPTSYTTHPTYDQTLLNHSDPRPVACCFGQTHPLPEFLSGVAWSEDPHAERRTCRSEFFSQPLVQATVFSVSSHATLTLSMAFRKVGVKRASSGTLCSEEKGMSGRGIKALVSKRVYARFDALPVCRDFTTPAPRL